MLETVAGANFGKIREPNGHAKFPRLHFFPAQLAGQPRGLAHPSWPGWTYCRNRNFSEGTTADNASKVARA